MTHKSSHVIIHKAREFISAWPLSTVSGASVLGVLVSWIF